MKISPIILTKGGFKERRIITKMFLSILRSLLITIQGSYDIVVKFWKLGSYIKGKRVVDLVHSRNSRFLKIGLISFDQVNH